MQLRSIPLACAALAWLAATATAQPAGAPAQPADPPAAPEQPQPAPAQPEQPAQPPAQPEQPAQNPDVNLAKQHYANAERAMQAGSFADAAREYELAHQRSGEATLLYKIGVAHQSAGDCAAAVAWYRRYLAEGQPDDEFTRRTNSRITACESGTGAGAAAATDAPDAPAGARPAAADGTVAADAADVPVAGAGERPPSFLDGDTTWQRDAGWIAVGVSIAFGVTGAILGVSASARGDDIATLIDLRDPLTDTPERYEGNVKNSYEDLVSEGRTLDTLAKVSLTLGGAAAAAAVVLFVIDPGVGAGDLAAIQPVLGRDTVGVAAGWEF